MDDVADVAEGLDDLLDDVFGQWCAGAGGVGATAARAATAVRCVYTVAVSPTPIYAGYLGIKIIGWTYKGDTFAPDPYRYNLGYIYGSSNGYTGWVPAGDQIPDGCT